jgi:hypothetical protein
MKRYYFLVMVILAFSGISCYTTLQHPYVADDVENPSEDPENVADASCLSCHGSNPHYSASIPARRMNSSGWNYYYNSAWWQDEYHNLPGSDQPPAPADFRQRFPNYDNNGSSVSSTTNSVYTTPALGKKTGEAAPDAQKSEPAADPRRDFDRRNDTKKSEGESRTQVERQPKRK